MNPLCVIRFTSVIVANFGSQTGQERLKPLLSYEKQDIVKSRSSDGFEQHVCVTPPKTSYIE